MRSSRGRCVTSGILAISGFRSFLLFPVATLLVAMAPSPGAAGTFTVFGPETYLRGTAQPATVVKSFSVLDPSAEYFIRIHNGGLQDGEYEKVSSSIVMLNGVQVVGPAELNQNVTVVEKPVSLRSSNEIGVEVRSKPGGAIIVQIFGIDVVPPAITASVSPAPNGAGWHASDATVSFTCTDETSGVAICPSPVVVTAEGAGQVVAGTAVDRAGNSTTTSASVNLDKTPPSVMASAGPPPNAAGWNNSDVVVATVCFDALSGVAVCPSPLAVTSEGSNQVVTAAATDLAGNSATAGVTLNIDKTAPTVTASVSPAPNAQQWNNTDTTVSFEAQDALSGLAAVSPPAIVTTEGMSQSVSGTATDRAGNTGSAAALVSIDKTPPAVAIESPAEGTIRRVPTVPVNGTAADANSLTSITVNGVEVGASSPFSTQVTLGQEGAQSLTAVARDIAGNSATASVGIVYSSPPVVKITSPADLAALGTTPVTVTGTVDDPEAAIKVGIEAIPAVVSGNTFVATGVPLREGGNVVTAVATDAQGNAGTDTVTLVLDTTAPRVHIDSPAQATVVTSPTISVTGRVNDIVLGTVNTTQAQVAVNGVEAQVSHRTFVATGVPLAPGSNTITALARDAVGNFDSTSVTILREATPGPRIAAVSGDGQSGRIGQTLAEPLVVSVTDGDGTALPGRTVLFRVFQNNAALLDDAGQGVRGLALTTDAQGRAQARFTLGSRAGVGNNRVDVTSPGISGAATFVASATAEPPAKISVDAGSGQRGAAGQPLPRPFVAVVTDQGHNRLADIPVTFTVVEGEGHFNGQSAITVRTDSDGRALAVVTLGPKPGIDNNVVEASVAEPGVFPAGFVASAAEVGDPAQTRMSGVVLDNANVPLLGVTVRVRGTALAAQTDAQGQFSLVGVPVGNVHLTVDGSTAQRPGTWPSLEYELVTVAGANNDVGMPIYLLPLDTANGIFVDETRGGTLTIPDVPGFSLTVTPNSATFPDGTRRGTITVTAVHPDKVPMVPNFGQQPRFIVTIQPPGVKFDPPAQVAHPNVDGLAPGEVTEIYSFDHDMGSFVATGTATVSEDGTVLRSDPGMGVVKGGWHCGGNPASSGTTHNCPECQKCVTTNCQPDDSQTPTQKAPDDCKKEVCRGGGPASDPNDSEKPEDEPGNCKEEICKGGSPDSKPDDADAPPGPFQKCCDGDVYDVDTEGCCGGQEKYDRYSQCCDNSTVKPGWPIANIQDVSGDCPNRDQRMAPTADGCGSGWGEPFIPENPVAILAAIVRYPCFGDNNPAFTPACNQHDKDWSICKGDKGAADGAFVDNIVDGICPGVPDPVCRGMCRLLGFDYGAAVSFVQQPYWDAQKEFCRCCPWP